MKYFISLSIALFFSIQFTIAQDDELSTFHSSKSKKGSASDMVDAKNAVYLNFGSCLRGASTIGYQRHLISGLAAYTELGIVVSDYIGRLDLDFDMIQDDNAYFTPKDALKKGRVFSLGTKYYFEQTMGGSYIGIDYTNFNIVKEMVVSTTAMNNYPDFNAPTENIRLPYNSNEYKFLLGVSSSESNFYSDVNMGVGLRNLAFREISNESINSYYNGSQTVGVLNYSTDYNTKIKVWFFFAVKLGYKF
jgi:hypothetical protein